MLFDMILMRLKFHGASALHPKEERPCLVRQLLPCWWLRGNSEAAGATVTQDLSRFVQQGSTSQRGYPVDADRTNPFHPVFPKRTTLGPPSLRDHHKTRSLAHAADGHVLT